MTQTEALEMGRYLQEAGKDANARLTLEQECIVRLYEIIAVDQEQK